MQNRKLKLGSGKIMTVGALYKAKERFHRELAALPFEEKITILMKMQKVVMAKKAL